jgi:hypothetical protein
MADNYFWKLKGLAKGVDPNEAVKELNRLQDVYGQLTPEVVVKEASNPNSVLHPMFEWEDERAGYLWRIQQARVLLNNIQDRVITDGEPKEIAVYEVTTKDEGYKNIDTFTIDDIEYVRASTLQQLTHLKGKLKVYKEFDKVVVHLDKAIEVIH